MAIIGDEGEDISGLINGASATAEDTVTENKSDATESAESAETGSADIPEGVTIVTMPRLSDTMEEGTVASWLKKVGDQVEEGDILAEIETDKATMEFESFQSGTLLHVGLKEGESAKVDSLLAIIGPAGTDVAGIAKSFKPASDEKPAEATAPKAETPKPSKAAPAASPQVAVAAVADSCKKRS